MKSYDVIAYVGEHDIYCTDCVDEDVDDGFGVIFVDDGPIDATTCEGCGAVWDPEDFCWYARDVCADQALREVCCE
jgi:hypothetical protein